MLQVENASKQFGGKAAVRAVTFAVERGAAFGLLGPNGAGKSTTIAMIAGLLTPDTGHIRVAGIDVAQNPRAARRVMGVVPQDIALYPTLSARENLGFWGAMYGLAGRELAARVDEALDVVGLAERQKERIDTYSGGMKRRISIAASLLHRPGLLIMDEPTVGIDPQSRNHILETVRRLNREQGTTVLYTSHYMEEVEYLCRQVAIMDGGALIARGPLEQVRRLAGTDTAVRLRVSGADPALAAAVAAVPGVRQVRADDGVLTALVAQAGDTLAPIIAAVGAAGWRVGGVEVDEPNLEAVFLHLTGRALRD